MNALRRAVWTLAWGIDIVRGRAGYRRGHRYCGGFCLCGDREGRTDRQCPVWGHARRRVWR